MSVAKTEVSVLPHKNSRSKHVSSDKPKYLGVEEMKANLKPIIEGKDLEVAFLYGSYSPIFEELLNSISKWKLSHRDIKCIKFGRLLAIIDLFEAYFKLRVKKLKGNSKSSKSLVSPDSHIYVS